MENNIIIRRATKEDIPGMVRLLEQLFSIEIDFNFNAEKQATGLKMLIKAYPKACVMVATIDERVVGMLQAQVSISTAEGALSMMLEDMVIESGYRKKGIGKKLIDEMQDWGERVGVVRMQLLADITNTNALDYYSHIGWKQTRMFCQRKYTQLYGK